MSDEQILAEIQRLIGRTGKPRILGALTGKGVGSSTAEQITSGRYVKKPGGLLRQALLDVIREIKAS